MSEMSTTVTIECDRCGRFLGRQGVFWLDGKLPTKWYERCAACREQEQVESEPVEPCRAR